MWKGLNVQLLTKEHVSHSLSLSLSLFHIVFLSFFFVHFITFRLCSFFFNQLFRGWKKCKCSFICLSECFCIKIVFDYLIFVGENCFLATLNCRISQNLLNKTKKTIFLSFMFRVWSVLMLKWIS
jgi:hypothetical protein